jgi:Fe-S cluster assembly iron-binding protein IscA
MLIITDEAVEAIKALVAPDEGRARISLTDAWSNGSGPGVTVEPVPAPELDDAVIETDGLELYVDAEALDALDEKILDAEEDGDAIRFSVHEQA